MPGDTAVRGWRAMCEREERMTFKGTQDAGYSGAVGAKAGRLMSFDAFC